MLERAGPPPYSATGPSTPSPIYQVVAYSLMTLHFPSLSRLPFMLRSGTLKIFVCGLTIWFIFLTGHLAENWSQSHLSSLSLEKLNEDWETCKKIHTRPTDPQGLGRKKNARYIDGGKPTLIKNAAVWVGEPVKGTSPGDARKGKGWEWLTGDVFLQYGLIQKVSADISSDKLPKGALVYDAKGRKLTSGIVDMHSHAGVYPLPILDGYSDGNELSENITPWARVIDGLYPLDPQIQVIKSGGVTTSLILPGSENNIGGEAYVIKHAVGKADGRKETSATDLLADPQRTWRYMKMACGENAKATHGKVGSRPFSRMGESYDLRHAFEQARALVQKQNDWCTKATKLAAKAKKDKETGLPDLRHLDEYLPQEIALEALAAVLRGQVHVNIHCYTINDLEAMVDHTNEFEFPIRAFHHAHQSYLVPEILNRTWGGRPPASAIYADTMYYKTEAYLGSEFAGKILYEQGFTPVYVSDNPLQNAQHVVFEAAKAFHYGLPYHAALAGVTSEPAELLGLGQRIGKVKPGYDADVVVWDSDPLSVGATPVQVWIDGRAQFDDPVELKKPSVTSAESNRTPEDFVEQPTQMEDAFFTGVTKVLLSDEKSYGVTGETVSVAISAGKISCLGECEAELDAYTSSGKEPITLKNGYLAHSFTGVGGTLGINAIDSEGSTDNGADPVVFSRAVDGLQLDDEKLHAATKFGVTRAISAPKFTDLGTHHGTSVGFVTSALTSLEEGAVFASDLAVHYTLNVNVRKTSSYSAAFGGLRAKLIAVATGTEPATDQFSEAAYLKKVLSGELVLALTINSADGIATALKIKSQVEDVMLNTYGTREKIKMAIIGGAEAHLVAKDLADESVGVILLPFLAFGEYWDSRRALTGAPLTNGTAVDSLIDAGVVTAIGMKGDYEIRELGFMAGIAYQNGGGRLSEKEALDLVSGNVYKILGSGLGEAIETGHFILSEGSPLEIGSRIKAVGSGQRTISVFL